MLLLTQDEALRRRSGAPAQQQVELRSTGVRAPLNNQRLG